MTLRKAIKTSIFNLILGAFGLLANGVNARDYQAAQYVRDAQRSLTSIRAYEADQISRDLEEVVSDINQNDVFGAMRGLQDASAAIDEADLVGRYGIKASQALDSLSRAQNELMVSPVPDPTPIDRIVRSGDLDNNSPLCERGYYNANRRKHDPGTLKCVGNKVVGGRRCVDLRSQAQPVRCGGHVYGCSEVLTTFNPRFERCETDSTSWRIFSRQ